MVAASRALPRQPDLGFRQASLRCDRSHAIADRATLCLAARFHLDHGQQLAGPDNVAFADQQARYLPRPDRDDLGRGGIGDQYSARGFGAGVGAGSHPQGEQADDRRQQPGQDMGADRLGKDDLAMDALLARIGDLRPEQG